MSKIAKLRTECAAADAAWRTALEASKEAQRRAQEAANIREALVAQLEAAEASRNTDIIVSDHALLRYIERVYECNVDELREQMLSGNVKHLIQSMGTGKYPIEGGRLVVRDNTVVTVLPPKGGR